MSEKSIFVLECDECGFAAQIIHTLDTESYALQYCPICNNDDIVVEESEEQRTEEEEDD